MEPRPDRPASPDAVAATDHQLPDGRTKVQRIADHSRGLVDDLKTWVELRLKLAQVEFWEEADRRANELGVLAVMGVLMALGGLFLLLGVAFLIGWALGNTFWGFLIVGAVLVLLGVVVKAANPRLADLRKPARLDAGKVSRGRAAAPHQ